MIHSVTSFERTLPQEVSEYCAEACLLPHLETAIRLVDLHFTPYRDLRLGIEVDPETDETAIVIDVILAMDVADVVKRKNAYTRDWVGAAPASAREKFRLLYEHRLNRAVIMDPRDFHALAVRLGLSASAADLRTAVSRSYYAVFNVGASHLRSMGFAVGKGAAAHGEVQKCLNNCGDSAVMAVATELNDLHGARNRADYQLDRAEPENRSNVLGIVTQAGDSIRVLDGAFQGSERAKLRLAILTWRHDNGYP